MIRRFSLFALFCALPVLATAWGRDGHAIIGQIAEDHLTPQARALVDELLEDGESLATVASWADEVRPDRDDTRPWHYVNWSLASPTPDYDPLTEQPEGNVLWATVEHARQTFDSSLPLLQRREALKFVTHFCGDLHQPLHCGTGDDRGGNQVYVAWEGENNNLHRIWDSSILGKIGKSHAEMVAMLNDRATTETVADVQSGTPLDWTIESRRLAARHAYGNLPEPFVAELREKYGENAIGLAGAFYEPGEADMVEVFYINRGEIKSSIQPELSGLYADMAIPVVKQCLLRGGLRLAKLLNDGAAAMSAKETGVGG